MNIFNIPSYSLLILGGILLANILVLYIFKKCEINIEDFILFETYSLAFAFLGAKLLYLFVIRDSINWSRIFEWNYLSPFIQGGFVFYGGLLGSLIGIYLVYKVHKVDIKLYISKVVFAIPLAHAFGRIGCYLAGCCYGMPYDGPFSVCYHDIPYSLCDVNLFPIQLVEAILLFILAIILFIITLKKNPTFNIVFAYLISYSIIRFILEYFRYDSQRGNLLFFSTSQWISLGIFLVSLLYLFIQRKKNNK